MRYIEINCGVQRLYIEEDKLAAIVEKPYVYRVPGQTAEIAGISYYMGSLVVYYLPPAAIGTVSEGYRCGVILKGRTEYYGILGDTVGEGNGVPEEMEQVIQGVWVIKSD